MHSVKQPTCQSATIQIIFIMHWIQVCPKCAQTTQHKIDRAVPCNAWPAEYIHDITYTHMKPLLIGDEHVSRSQQSQGTDAPTNQQTRLGRKMFRSRNDKCDASCILCFQEKCPGPSQTEILTVESSSSFSKQGKSFPLPPLFPLTTLWLSTHDEIVQAVWCCAGLITRSACWKVIDFQCRELQEFALSCA